MSSTVRFHRSIYDPAAVDTAAAQFSDFAEIVRGDDNEYLVVEVRHVDPDRARRVADELSNTALGLTVENGGLPEVAD